MDPNETRKHSSGRPENVADRNVERLLTGAYRPEVPDPEFVRSAAAAMHAAARRQTAARGSKQARAITTRLIGWTVAAALLVGVGVILGSGLLAPRGDRPRQLVDRPEDGPPTQRDRIPVAKSLPPTVGTTGLTAQPRPKAPPIETLAVGEELATGRGQRRRLALEDGSVLYLNRETTVKLDGPRHVTLRRGEIFVEVAPQAADDLARRFVVATPDRRIIALGTRFNVRTGDQGTRVVVTQGKVRISGMELPLLAGQQLDPQGRGGVETEPPVSAAPRAAHLLNWTRDLMATAATPLVPDSQHAGGALIVVDPSGRDAKLSLRKYHVDVHIEDGFARTTIDQTYFNHEPRRLEGTFYFPLPPDASLSRLAMYVGGRLMEGGMVEREHGREVFETIMYRQKDPALLEWVDGSTFKMRVFPLEGRQEKRIVLSYTQRLHSLYDRTQYRFPGGHNMQLVGQWSARLHVKNGAALRWESDSHEFDVSGEDGDLVLRAEAQKIKPDRDVVLTLYEPGEDSDSLAGARFATAAHEGSRYLMLRWRPELPAQKRHQRRDWVFLFEASGDRGPLLARVQVDVIKTLLENAEHDDTFSIITAGTRVHTLAAKSQAATPENVDKAVEFLEQTHLVGALDLQRALDATGPPVEAAENPVLVHVGSGTPVLGQRDVDALVRRIPKGARYVGIGVGKRWSRTLMKAAAARTGGYFTQINPDEQVTWRAFELLSTLNAPRLLGVKVADKLAEGAEQSALLCYNDSLAQGEELCAIARFDDGRPLPESVEVTGLLDGKPYSQTVPVGDVADGADYLPRTWAKLDIDRLVALGAVENKAQIIELSKAMYVMSPFTSLIVLENEQMYQQYKVDRGRKDHWALYPCPEKIPVVYEPDPLRPVRDVPEGAAVKKPSAARVLQTILVRIPPDVLHWPNRPQRSGGQTVPVLQLFNGQSAAQHGFGGMGGFRGGGFGGGFGGMSGSGTVGGMGMTEWGLPNGLLFSEFNGDGRLDRQGMPFTGIASSLDGRFLTSSGWDSSERLWEEGSRAWSGPVLMDELSRTISRRVNPGGTREMTIRSNSGGLVGPVQIEMLEGLDVLVITGHQRDVNQVTEIIRNVEALSAQGEPGPPPIASRPMPRSEGFFEYIEGSVSAGDLWVPRTFRVNLAPLRRHTRRLEEDDTEADEKYRLTGEIGALAYRIRRGTYAQSLAYQQPSFNSNWYVFHDLLSYAPGMNTSMADVRAALEAEAQPKRATAPGRIDKKARGLINKARAAGWQRATIRGKKGEVLLAVDFDGTGRYRYERTTAGGLGEEVVCDGTNLWHLYGELGLGARRKLSRFHRAQLARLVPWALPPAEELAHGADLVAIDGQTVAIVPQGAEGVKDEDGKPVDYLCVQMVFGSDGRLAERRLVKMPSAETLLRQTYEADGAVKLLGAEDKVLREWKVDLTPCGAPALKPDEKRLVVLPLPYRTIQSIYQARNLDDRFETYSEEDALAALAGYLAAGRHEARQIIGRRFFSRGDRRVGFYALLIAGGHTWDPEDKQNFGNNTQLLCDPLEDHPDHPLAQYVAAYLKLRSGQQQEFNLPAVGPAEVAKSGGFLRDLAQFRDLWQHFSSGRGNQGNEENRKQQRHRALEFVRNCRSPVFGWALLSTVRNYGGGQEFYRMLGEAALSFEKVPALAYVARYEHARGMLNSGDPQQAQELFGKLYEETLERGFLPPIDSSFRQAFHSGPDGVKKWQAMVRRTSDELISEGARAAAVRLAWQVHQLGDQPLAEELLGLALAGTPEEEQLPTTLAAVEYLWHTGQRARADALLQPLMDHKTYAKWPSLWRLAAMLAESRGMTARALSCLEKAMEIEYEDLPEVVNLQVIRQDYGRLLSRYQQLATAIATLEAEPPKRFVGRVVRAADRWRQVDTDPTAACQAAARILGDLGAAEMAWEYLTTPLAAKPNEAAPWVSMANMLRQQGHFELADRAYASAFDAEPTNAQILWDRAQVLLQAGRAEDAKELFGQLAEGQWQPRFGGLKSRARQYAERD